MKPSHPDYGRSATSNAQDPSAHPEAARFLVKTAAMHAGLCNLAERKPTMKTVYKYKLDAYNIGDPEPQTVMLPHGARLLHVDSQYGQLILWAEVLTDARPREVTYYVVGTGCTVPDGAQYIGTVLFRKGILAAHVYVQVPW